IKATKAVKSAKATKAVKSTKAARSTKAVKAKKSTGAANGAKAGRPASSRKQAAPVAKQGTGDRRDAATRGTTADEPLALYRAKRNFERTPEPGVAPRKRGAGK